MPLSVEDVEELAAAAMLIEPADLTALASLHSQVEKLGQAAGAANDATGTAVSQPCQRALKLIESIILHEAANAEEALNGLRGTIAEIQTLLKQGATPGAPPSVPASTPAENNKASAPAAGAPSETASMQESPIRPDDAGLVHEFLAEANSHIDTAEAELLKLEHTPTDKAAINAVFRAFHTVKGVAGFLGLKQIGALAHAAENILDLARKDVLSLAGDPINLVLESVDMLKQLLASLEQALKNNAPPRTEPGLDVLIAKFKSLQSGGGEKREPANNTPAPATQPAPVAAARAATALSATAPTAPATPVAPTTPQPAGAQQAKATATDASVKVPMERLDKLINAVGELVIAQAMVQQNRTGGGGDTEKFTRNLTQLGKITRELQDLVMSMRMVPIQSVFQKTTRIVRDIAKKTGKEMDLVMEGGETELDRVLVDAISDPLVHMIRNAADHGLEMPDVREKCGKPRLGTILLRACHQSGHIVIEIRDDGKGLDKKRIVQKATQAGLVKPDQQLTDQEIFKLIFHPGLSTAEKVTDVSGRGVGMDVVKRNIETLHGRVEITSAEGKGSSFMIRLPLTLAVIDGLLVRVGGERFIFPITTVEQTVQPSAHPISTVQNHGEVVNLRGSLLPLHRLKHVFGLSAGEENYDRGLIVVVQENEKRFCLFVDELIGQQQVVIKSLGKGLGRIKGISGAAILGDGNVSLILDVPGLRELTCGH